MKMRNVIIGGALVGIVASLSLPAIGRLAAGSLSRSADAGQIPLLTLRGSVIDTLTHKPIAGALVDLDRDPPQLRSNRFASREQDPAGSEQRTDANGRFAFTHVSWENHFFSITKPGYVSATNDKIEYSSYEVRPGPELESLRMFLTPAAEVAGHVTSTTGQAIKGVPLTLYRKQVEDGRGVWQRASDGSTDGKGSYSFRGLQSGIYTVVSGWMFDHDPGPPPGPGCSSESFVPQAGYLPAANPGVSDFSSAIPIVVAEGKQAVADLRLEDQTFHHVTLDAYRGIGFPSVFSDRNGRALEMSETPGTHCTRSPFWYYEPRTRQRMVNLPDGSYTFQTQAGFVKADGTIGKPRSQWLGSYARFTVSGKDLVLPPEPISSELGPSTTIRAHLDPQTLHAHGPLSDLCSGTVRTSVSSPRQASGKQPVQFPNIWLSRAGALSEVSLHIKPTIQNGGSLEFADLEPGSYWVHADEIDNGYVAAITAAGVDMSHEPLVVGLNGKSASLDVTLSTACGGLRLNHAWPKPSRNSVGIDRVFFGELVPQFPGFAGQHTVMFEQDRGDDVTIGNLAPGHYKFYLVRRERGVEFRNPQSAQTALPPGQDVWVKPRGKVEVSVTEPPTE